MTRHAVLLMLVPLLIGVGPMVASGPVLTGCAQDECDKEVDKLRNDCLAAGGEPVDCHANTDNNAFSFKCDAQCACVSGSGN